MSECAGLGQMHQEDPDYIIACDGCGSFGECTAECPRAAYEADIQDRINRLGWELAFAPDEMECYDCGRHLPLRICQIDRWGMPYFMRRVVGLGPIAEAHRDPTQTYRLQCGHSTI